MAGLAGFKRRAEPRVGLVAGFNRGEEPRAGLAGFNRRTEPRVGLSKGQSFTITVYSTGKTIDEVWSTVAPSNMLTTRIGPCSDNPSTVVAISEMSLNTRLYDSSLSGQINITQNFDNGWVIKGTMQKCQDIRNLDTCDYFKSFLIIRSGCSEDENYSEDQEIISMFFHHIHPRMGCPIQAGTYNILSYPVFTEDNYLIVAESKISTSVFGYTLKLEGFSDNVTDRVLCVEAYFRLLYIRENNEDKKDEENGMETWEPSNEEESDEALEASDE